MEQLDVLNKDKLNAGLRFIMQTAGTQPSTASYFDNEFRVDLQYKGNEVFAIVTRESMSNDKKIVDHTLSDLVVQFLRQQALVIRTQQSRLQTLAEKFKK